jgi:predicted nuclease of predicted toxin-antitoxin system
MKLLLDNNVSERLIGLLAPAGWDVVHVRALGLHAAKDSVVLDIARSQSRVLVSADTDFGALLAASRATSPSVVLVRRLVGRRTEELAGILLANLGVVSSDLEAGSIVTIEAESLRIRRLPIA